MKKFLLIVILGGCTAGWVDAEEDPVVLASEKLAGTADVLRLGQSFTISKPVIISSVEIYAKRINGGSSFQVSLQSYDPWTATRGAILGSKSVPLADIPSNPEGGWVKATFDTPVSITTSGVYALFVDSDSAGAPAGYNDLGYAGGDSIRGGRLIGPIFGSEVEMLFRLRGNAETSAFTPVDFVVPKLSGPTLTTRYSAVAKRNLIYAKISWYAEPGAAYVIWSSKEMKTWFSTPRLGNGTVISYERSNEYWNSTFMRVQVMPLGDYKKIASISPQHMSC